MLAGTSFKHEHLAEILAMPLRESFFEVHAENYMGAGGPPHRALGALRETYPISLHGVGMSIGGEAEIDQDHLARFRGLVQRYEPFLVSEHLAWSSHGDVFYNDLLPVPYDARTLDRVCDHLDQVQVAIGRPLLLENPSTYVAFERSTMPEAEFIREVVRRTGCGLLLDVSNAWVSATNHGMSVADYFDRLPLDRVGEIHLAGFTEQLDADGTPLLIDSHDKPVAEVVWSLYELVVSRIGARPTLVEWDSDLPAWPVLYAEAEKARRFLRRSVSAGQGSHHVLA